MKIVVLSGKGGTGKTTIATNLAYLLSEEHGVCLADMDVEEPDVEQFFNFSPKISPVKVPVPDIDLKRCTFCGKCADFCRYGALLVLKDRVICNNELCHSCGGCLYVCPEKAISEKQISAGVIHDGFFSPSLHIISGVLNEGSVKSTAILHAVKDAIRNEPFVIADGPPGTACLAIEAVSGADFCLLVTEPTPFGLHDLRKMVEVIHLFKVPSAVVINRSDDLDEMITTYCKVANLPVLMKIPFSHDLAMKQGSGKLIAKDDPTWRERFLILYQECFRMAGGL